MSVEVLESELAFYEAHRKELLSKAEGKFVLIKGQRDHGFFDDPLSAYKVGVDRFGLQPFLIKRVVSEDPVHNLPACCLGLTHATL